MKKRLNADTMNVNGKTVNVGIDVHKVSWHVTALVEGVIVESATIKPCYRVLKKLLARFVGGTIRIAYEAGPTGFSLYDDLTADGMDCIVVPPSLIPVESGNRVKTDKRDSRKLAQWQSCCSMILENGAGTISQKLLNQNKPGRFIFPNPYR